jgi:hypothetical protein
VQKTSSTNHCFFLFHFFLFFCASFIAVPFKRVALTPTLLTISPTTRSPLPSGSVTTKAILMSVAAFLSHSMEVTVQCLAAGHGHGPATFSSLHVTVLSLYNLHAWNSVVKQADTLHESSGISRFFWFSNSVAVLKIDRTAGFWGGNVKEKCRWKDDIKMCLKKIGCNDVEWVVYPRIGTNDGLLWRR